MKANNVKVESSESTESDTKQWVDELQQFVADKRDELTERQYSKVVQDIDHFLQREEDSLSHRVPKDRKRIVADLYCIYSEGLGALGEYDRAHEASKQAVDLCPNWYRGYSTLAQIVAFQQRLHSEAIELFEMALDKEMTEEQRTQIQKRYDDLQVIAYLMHIYFVSSLWVCSQCYIFMISLCETTRSLLWIQRVMSCPKRIKING